MKTIGAISFLLIAGVTICTADEQRWIDYRLASNLDYSSKKSIRPFGYAEPTCTTTGRVCDAGCKNVWICVNNQGVLEPRLLEICTGDNTCNAGACSTTPTPECSPAAQKAFVCQAEGVFPDPMTCKKYHYCIEREPKKYEDISRSCEANYGYNSGTTYCAKPLDNDHCGADYPVPICTAPGQKGPLMDNKSMYYVCSLYENIENILYPYLYLCRRGYIYDALYGCRGDNRYLH